MKIDPKTELRDFAGEPIKLNTDSPNMTFRDVVTVALRAAIQEDTVNSLESKLTLERIGLAAYQDVCELTIEQAAIIRERVAKVFTSPAVAGAFDRVFDK